MLINKSTTAWNQIALQAYLLFCAILLSDHLMLLKQLYGALYSIHNNDSCF